MTTLLVSCLLATQTTGVSNVVDHGPQSQHDAVMEVATMVNTALWAPDKTARGFSLRSIEMAKVPAGFSGLGERHAVRMRFINKHTTTAFDIYQVPTSKSVNASKHMDWLLKGGYFEGGVSHLDTFVSMKRGDMDIAFVGGLVSEPSAKELLSRLVSVKPDPAARRN
jgi:hypothetical protein